MRNQLVILCVAGDMAMGADMPVIYHTGLRLPQSTKFSTVLFADTDVKILIGSCCEITVNHLHLCVFMSGYIPCADMLVVV